MNSAKVVENLQSLKEAVINQPEDLFDMLHFGRETECGTACCALGSFALSEKGKALGLKLIPWINGPQQHNNVINLATENLNYVAGAEVLGISEKESLWLFIPCEYFSCDHDEDGISKKSVLNRIDNLIDKYKSIRELTC